MARIQTISLLNLLDKSEMTLLGKFLKSPFFTAKKFLYPLFLELRKAMKKPEEELESGEESGLAVTPESIFVRVFPGEQFGDGHKWNKALSDLNAAIEQFLIVQHTLDDPGMRLRALVATLYTRNDETYFRRSADSLLNYLTDRACSETTEDWHLQFWTRKYAHSYPLSNQAKNPEDVLNDLEKKLDTYCFISKMQLACNRASAGYLLQTSIDSPQPFLEMNLPEPLENSALAALYRAMYHLLTLPKADFESFFGLLKEQGSRVEREELESLIVFTLNYCSRCHRNGDPDAFGWYRRVYDWGDMEQVWTGNVKIEDTFLNHGFMFARSKDTEGFNAFLEKGQAALPKDRREIAVQLLRAYQLFYLDRFDETASQLIKVADNRQPRYTLYYHSLKVRNNYEIWLIDRDKFEELEQSLANFEGFLLRNNYFSQSFRQAFRNQIWFIRKLMHYGEKRALSKDELLEALKQRPPAALDWITVKIGRLPG